MNIKNTDGLIKLLLLVIIGIPLVVMLLSNVAGRVFPVSVADSKTYQAIEKAKSLAEDLQRTVDDYRKQYGLPVVFAEFVLLDSLDHESVYLISLRDYLGKGVKVSGYPKGKVAWREDIENNLETSAIKVSWKNTNVHALYTLKDGVIDGYYNAVYNFLVKGRARHGVFKQGKFVGEEIAKQIVEF